VASTSPAWLVLKVSVLFVVVGTFVQLTSILKNINTSMLIDKINFGYLLLIKSTFSKLHPILIIFLIVRLGATKVFNLYSGNLGNSKIWLFGFKIDFGYILHLIFFLIFN
jgi:hypothetical protein